jgi:hypothetical protein
MKLTTARAISEQHAARELAALVWWARNYPESSALDPGPPTDHLSLRDRGHPARPWRVQHRATWTLTARDYILESRLVLDVDRRAWLIAIDLAPPWLRTLIETTLNRAPRDAHARNLPHTRRNPDRTEANHPTHIAPPDLEHHHYDTEVVAWLEIMHALTTIRPLEPCVQLKHSISSTQNGN